MKKWSWIATECAKGWRLKLAIGEKDYNLKGLVIKTVEGVNAVAKGNVVFIQLKDSKFEVNG